MSDIRNKAYQVKKYHELDRLIGNNLKSIRILENYTQTKLANELGISFQQIQKYETGKNRVSVSVLYKLSKILNRPIIAFLDGLDILADAKHEKIFKPDAIELLSLFESLSPAAQKSVKQLIKGLISRE